MATYTEFLNTISSNVAQRVLKIEVLNSDEEVLDEISTNIIGGDIQSNDNIGARRNASVEFSNIDGLYIPDPSGNIWMNKKFRIYTGAKVGDENYYISRGIFLCSEPEIQSKMAESSVSIQFLDKFALLNGELGGTIENTYIIPVATNITTVIQDILTAAGEVKDPIIEPTSETTPYTIIKEAGSTFAELLIEIANMLSWTCYFDSNGYFRFEPQTDLTTAGSKWDFTTDEVYYLGSSHTYEFTNVYNHVVVIGDNINGSTFRATASDDSSPTTGISVVGKKTLVINDSLIYNLSLAQERADAELQKSISIVEAVNIPAIPLDIIQGGDVITITDPSSDLNGDRFLVKSVSFPLLVDGEMTLNCWKGRVL